MSRLDQILDDNFNLGFARINPAPAKQQLKEMLLRMIDDNEPEWETVDGKRMQQPVRVAANEVRNHSEHRWKNCESVYAAEAEA